MQGNWWKLLRNWYSIKHLPSMAVACLAFVFGFGWLKGAAMAADRPPNIVWLVQDHVPWRQIVATEGPKPVLPTYQRLAQNGVEFLQARAATPLCMPARGSMMTGVYPHNHGITGNDAVTQERNTFYPEYKPFNQYLQAAGYVAGYFGKYHAGPIDPLQLGFEGYAPKGYGDPYTTPRYAQYLRDKGLPKPSVDLEWQIPNATKFGSTSKQVSPTSNGGMAGRLTTPPETHESYFVAALASDWIDQRAKSGDNRPFVLRVDTWGPHQPYLVSEPFQNLIDPKQIPEYPNFSNTFADRPVYQQQRLNFRRSQLGMTEWADWQPLMARIYENFAQTDSALLQVLDALERNGLTQNTIIIYTADHGDIAGSGGGLFDKDAFMTEEVMSIPLVIKWPGVTDGGGKSSALVSNLDIVPTVLEMAGIKVPDAMDGKSVVPLLRNPDAAWRDDWMGEHHGHLETKVFQRALYYKNYKFVAHLDDKDEFYDLAADPFEMKNRIDDPSVQPMLFEMKSRLVAEMAKTGDDAPDAKRLIEQLGMDYATVYFGDQQLRIGFTKDNYPIELPYGVASPPEVRVTPLDEVMPGKRLTFRIKPTESLPGDTVIEAYDEAGVLVHSAHLQFSVAGQPRTQTRWGDAQLLGRNQGVAYVGGQAPLSVGSSSPADAFSRVQAMLVPLVEDQPAISAAMPVYPVYNGTNLPNEAVIDTHQFPDGYYELQINLQMKDGREFVEAHPVIIKNWNVMVDDLEPPQDGGWFGLIKRRTTVQESEGWITATDPVAALFDDRTRLAPQGPAPQYLIWEAAELHHFTITLYTQDVTAWEQVLTVAVAPDLATWQPVALEEQEITPVAQGWYKVTLSGEVGKQMPVKYLRILVQGGAEALAKVQLGQIVMASPVN